MSNSVDISPVFDGLKAMGLKIISSLPFWYFPSYVYVFFVGAILFILFFFVYWNFLR